MFVLEQIWFPFNALQLNVIYWVSAEVCEFLELIGHEHREVDYAEGEDVNVYEADKEALDATICKVLRIHPQNERAYHYCMHGLVYKEDDLSGLILFHNQSYIVDECHQIP